MGEAYGGWLPGKLGEVLGRDPGLRLVLQKESGDIFWTEITEEGLSSTGQVVLVLETLRRFEGRMELLGVGLKESLLLRINLTDEVAVLPKDVGGHRMCFSELRREPET